MEYLEKNEKKNSKTWILWVVIAIEAIFLGGLGYGVHRQKETIQAQEQTIEEISSDTFVAEEIGAEIDIDVMTEQIQAIGELATVEYPYTDAGKFEDSKKVKGVSIPLTKKSFLVKWDGLIKAGVDVKEIDISTDTNAKKITVEIPEAKILSNEIYDDSLEVLDENNNVFNKITVDNVTSFIGESKDFMVERATANGILEKAGENAKTLILDFMESSKAISDDYQIEVTIVDSNN